MRTRRTGCSATSQARLARCVGAALVVASLAPWVWGRDVLYTVQPGDNPWNISSRYLHSMDYWPRLQDYNTLTDPHHIVPGTVLRIPESWFAPRSRKVEVLAVEGEAVVVDRHGGQAALKPGETLAVGSVIRTAEQASLTLGLADASRVLILGGSQVEVMANRQHPYGPARDVRLQLREGRLENRVESRGAGAGRFEIRAPSVVAAVRGTRFRMTAAEGRTITEVTEGTVLAAGKSQRTELAAGYGAVFDRDKAAPRRKLLAAPRAEDLPPLVERMPAQLSIDPIDGAAAYRTLISPETGFETVISDQRATLPVLRIRDIPDGDYFVRVRGVDSSGIEGFEAQRRITINARPEPPFLLEPGAEAQTSASQPVFRWTRRVEGTAYHFQLAQDPQFASTLIDRGDLQGDHFAPQEALPPGLYHWRVGAIDPAEGAGPFSEAQILRRLPDAPSMEPAPSGDQPSLRWSRGGPNDRYQLQMARDQAFSDVLVDEELDDAQYSPKGLAAGTYYVRLRTHSADGYASAWSDAQQFELRSQWNWYWLLLFPVLLGVGM